MMRHQRKLHYCFKPDSLIIVFELEHADHNNSNSVQNYHLMTVNKNQFNCFHIITVFNKLIMYKIVIPVYYHLGS